MLLAIAGIVLLVACANLANLLLARAGARHREIGVRLSLGASRGRVVRQLLTESALLSALGVAGGVFLSSLMSDTLVSLIGTANNTVELALRTDWRALAFASTLGIVTCVLFGLAPVLRATRGDTAAPLKTATRGVVGADRSGLRRALVVAHRGTRMPSTRRRSGCCGPRPPHHVRDVLRSRCGDDAGRSGVSEGVDGIDPERAPRGLDAGQ